MKRKLLAICLASLIILQLGGVTIFAQNQECEPVIAEEATIEVEPNETKVEQDEENDSQTISIDIIETENEIEADGDTSVSNNDDTEIPESNQDIIQSLDNTLTENDEKSTSETETSGIVETNLDIIPNDEVVEISSVSSETEKLSDDSEQFVVLDKSDIVVSNESKAIQTEDYDYINRNVSDSLFENSTIVFEQNEIVASNSSVSFNELQKGNAASTNSVASDIYTTAPTIFNATSLRLSDPEVAGLRFGASVTIDQRNAAYEYGFIICLTSALENSGTELTFENGEITFVKGIAYNSEQGIDIIYDTDGSTYSFTGVLVNITKQNYVAYLTARPYIIYNIEGTLTTVYGSTYSSSVYRTAKRVIASNTLDTEQEAVAMGYVLDAEDAVSLSTAIEVDINDGIERSIGKDPDIDIIKICPTTSAFYRVLFSSEQTASFEVLDDLGFELTATEINNMTNETAYLLEKNQTYYIRVRGNHNTDYSIEVTPCLQDAIIYDFVNGIDGFTFGYGATAVSEGGILNISIDKSAGLTKAYAQNSNLSIDLFDYSRLIIRMKNTTDTTKLEGAVAIDLEYDGSSINYTLESEMPASMTEFQNIEFDFITRYGAVSSLKLSFGQILSSLSGNIYIDSIAILPMPAVLAWEFNADGDSEGWANNDQINPATVIDGVYELEMLGSVTGMAPAISSPGTSAYDLEKFDTLKIGLKNETDSNIMRVYFSTLAEGNTSFSESKKFVVEVEPLSDEFIEYTIDLTEHELFTDSLKDIMISIPAEGTASIDYIRLSKKEVEYNDIIWDFNDSTTQGIYSNNGRHTIAVADGMMNVVSSNDNNGGLYIPSQLGVPTLEYKYLVIGVNSASVTSNFEIYFKTDMMNGYKANDATNKIVYEHIIQIEKSDTFKEYVVELPSVPDEGWVSGYEGTLLEFMTALTTAGTFEFDYFKLTDGINEDEFNISVAADNEYKFVISKDNNQTLGTYTLNYDPNVLELLDACVFSYECETDEGNVFGTDITITSVSNNMIEFTVTDKTAAGAINCLRFKALDTVDTWISVITCIE